MARFILKPEGLLGDLKPVERAALARRPHDAVILRAPTTIVVNREARQGAAGDVCVTRDGAQFFMAPAEFRARALPLDAEGEAVLRDLGGGEPVPAPAPTP